MALTAVAALAQHGGSPDSRFLVQSQRFVPEGGPPIDLTFTIDRDYASQRARVVNATHAVLSMLSAWFGPLGRTSLEIISTSPVDRVRREDTAGYVAVPLRWIAPVRDQQSERVLIDGLVREFWTDQTAPLSTFGESVIAYIATRAIHQHLEGSNFQTVRFFGGFVPFPLRSVLLSPPVGDPRPRVWRFDDPGHALTRPVSHGILALQSIERYVGWPTMLETLTALRAAGASTLSESAFSEKLSEMRGTDLRFLVGECFHEEATFDYAVADLVVKPGAADLTEATVTIARSGTGRFALAADAHGDAAMPLMVRFADGTEFRDVFNGAAPSATMVYSARAPATGAFVDPDAMLLLDVNRENNAIVRDAPVSKLGVRLALHWLSWLQNAMLSYTALV